MKRIALCIAAFLVVASVGGCGNQATSETSTAPASTTEGTKNGESAEGTAVGDIQELNYKISFSGTDQGIDAVGVNKFIELIGEESGGKISVTGFSNSQLAGGNMERQMELLMQGGAFEIAVLSEQVLAGAASELNVVGVPFAFSSYDEVYEYADGTGGEWMEEVLSGIGLKYLGSFSNGFVHLTNNKQEVHAPEDVKGMKFRVIGDVQMQLMTLLGTDAINMSWSEVYSAMQQGTIDGHLNPWMSIYSGNIMEVQKYITELGINWGGFHFVMNLADWNSLNEDTQNLIAEACHEAAVYAREYQLENEATIRQSCIDEYGCTVTELTEDEIAVFQEALESVRESMMEEYGDAACTAWGLK